MTTPYKLTDQGGWTRARHYNACLWGEGVSHSGTSRGELCGPGWIHAYTHPLLAVMLNPVHAAIPDPRLWVAEGKIARRDGQLKVGCRKLTTVREIPLPFISQAARVRFSILCAKAVRTDPAWAAWANGWLSGKDRSHSTAWAQRWVSPLWTFSEGGLALAAIAAAGATTHSSVAAAAANSAVRAASEATIDLVALIEQAIADEEKRTQK